MTEVPPSDGSPIGEYDILVDWLKIHFSHIDQEELHHLLWSCTCFPFGKADMVREQFQECYNKANGDPNVMYAIAEKEIDDAMEEYFARQSGE